MDPNPQPKRHAVLRALGWVAVGLVWMFSLYGMLLGKWMTVMSLTPRDRVVGTFLLWGCLAALAISTGFGVSMLFRRAKQTRFRAVGDYLIGVGFVALVIAGGAAVHRNHWRIRLAARPRMAALPIDAKGYTLERLPFYFRASFARGRFIYLVGPNGVVSRIDDRTPTPKPVRLGDCGLKGPQLLFVSSKGVMFVSRMDRGVHRSTDDGKTWSRCLERSAWRMDEDANSGRIYVGNYETKSPRLFATLYASDDQGKTWETVFEDNRVNHIHSVRCDPKERRVYLAIGDGNYRGEAYSDDEGKSWKWIMQGRKHGHADVALAGPRVIWGSDDMLGRVIVADRKEVEAGETVLWCANNHAYFVVARGDQIYVGGHARHGWPAYLVASDDGAKSWQALIKLNRPGPAANSFEGESRRLSESGWLYFSDQDRRSYRVRRTPTR